MASGFSKSFTQEGRLVHCPEKVVQLFSPFFFYRRPRFFVAFGLRGPSSGPGVLKNGPRVKNCVGWTPGGVRRRSFVATRKKCTTFSGQGRSRAPSSLALSADPEPPGALVPEEFTWGAPDTGDAAPTAQY